MYVAQVVDSYVMNRLDESIAGMRILQSVSRIVLSPRNESPSRAVTGSLSRARAQPNCE